MKILVDNREDNRRIDSCVKFFTDKNYNRKILEYINNDTVLKVETLPVGDYVFDDKVVFEYKTSDDIIGSIIDGRVFKQALRMQEYPYHYIIIVGDVVASINKRNQRNFNNIKRRRSFTVKQYLGALARLSIDTHVVHVDNRQQAWYLMERIVTKVDMNVEAVTTPSLNLENPVATFLSCVPVNHDKLLSQNKALLICESLNLCNLSDLFSVSYDDLVSIRGIGVKTAYSIMECIGV